MNKCDCWYLVGGTSLCWDFNGVCLGTEEMERCRCNGDTSKCDFYPEKRKENKTMKTLEMMNVAKDNGKLYSCDPDTFYSHDTGFVDLEYLPCKMEDFGGTVDKFFEIEWQEVNTTTRAEAEEKYGIKIIG